MKVKKTIILISIILVAIFVTTLTFGSLDAQAADKVYRLKIQSAYPRSDPSMELLKDFASTAKRMSKGRIRIQVFADPELVPAEQLFEATQRGTLDMLHAVAAMWGGILPIGEVEFGPVLWICCARSTPNRAFTGWMFIPMGLFSPCRPRKSRPVMTCGD